MKYLALTLIFLLGCVSTKPQIEAMSKVSSSVLEMDKNTATWISKKNDECRLLAIEVRDSEKNPETSKLKFKDSYTSCMSPVFKVGITISDLIDNINKLEKQLVLIGLSSDVEKVKDSKALIDKVSALAEELKKVTTTK